MKHLANLCPQGFGKRLMLEIARNFERMVAGLSPIFQVGLGIAAVLIGLFVWLGGLGFRKLLVAIVGAAGGAVCVFFIIGRNIMPALGAAAIAACLAVIFEKIFITILTAALAAIGSFLISAELYKADFSDGLKHVCSQLPMHCWPIIAAVLIIFIVAGFYLWRPTSALCCATLGTMLVFAGMILLLLHKGTQTVSYIGSRSSFFAAVFVAMVVFGTLEQLLFCQPAKMRATRGTKEADEAPQGWRNR